MLDYLPSCRLCKCVEYLSEGLAQLFHWLGILSVVLTYDTFSLTVGLLGCKIVSGGVSGFNICRICLWNLCLRSYQPSLNRGRVFVMTISN